MCKWTIGEYVCSGLNWGGVAVWLGHVDNMMDGLYVCKW